MTSVQNRRPLSSGNSFAALLLTFIILTSSACHLFRTVEDYEPDDPVVVKPDEPKPDPDTVDWENNPDEKPPITSPKPKPPKPKPPKPGEPKPDNPVTPPNPDTTDPPVIVDPDNPDTTDPKDPEEPVVPPTPGATYNIAVIAPFYSSKNVVGEIGNKTTIRSLDFYGGVKMATDRLRAEGVNANVYVYDSEGSAGQVTSIMSRPEFGSMDLIIGPRKTDPVKTAASRVKNGRAKLVSPWTPKTGITYDNPNYIQVSPSLKSHCEAIMAHIHANHDPSKVVLACRLGSSEPSYFKYFQDHHKVLSGSAATPRLPEFQAEYGNSIPVAQHINQGDTTIFVIPSWDEKFVSVLLRKIYIDRGSSHIIVYGMPQWEGFDRVGYEYYERLRVRISTDNFMDLDDPMVQDFRRDFYYKHGTVPHKDALMGYDLALYFGRLLKKRGNGFNQYLDQEHADDYLHTRFHFEAEYRPGSDAFNQVMQYENKYLNILEFKDFKFQRMN